MDCREQMPLTRASIEEQIDRLEYLNRLQEERCYQ